MLPIKKNEYQDKRMSDAICQQKCKTEFKG